MVSSRDTESNGAPDPVAAKPSPTPTSKATAPKSATKKSQVRKTKSRETDERIERLEDIRGAEGQRLFVGSTVMTLVDQYSDEWFFNWPGLVTGFSDSGAVKVEFMGWGNSEGRTVDMDRTELREVKDANVLARIDRIKRQISFEPERRGPSVWRKNRMSSELDDE